MKNFKFSTNKKFQTQISTFSPTQDDRPCNPTFTADGKE